MKRINIFLLLFAISQSSLAYQLKEYKYELNQELKNKINQIKKQNVVVATIDTGLDTNHEAIIGNVYINSGEFGPCTKNTICKKSDNKIDDDTNGVIDDVNGYDFSLKTPLITDSHGHGTHIAGLILYPFKNINSNTQIMSLNYYNEKSESFENLTNSIKSLEYAVNNNVSIINYSGGGSESDSQEKSILKKAEEKGIIILVAAGNESSDLKNNPYYPCSYNFSNIICVGNAYKNENLVSSSNYGVGIDVFLTGDSVLSTFPNNLYRRLTGTSQSVAILSGMVALAKSIKPSITAQEIKKILKETSTEANSIVFPHNNRTLSSEVYKYLKFNPDNFFQAVLKK